MDERTRPLRRRTLLKAAAGAVGVAAAGRAFSPLLGPWDSLTLDEVLQRHYSELTPEDKERVFRRLEEKARQDYGVAVTISDPQPRPRTKFGYALNLSLCIGCRQCAQACHRENNHDRRTRNTYITVMEIGKGTLDLSRANSRYDHPVPLPDKTYMPVQCQQCDRPPCTAVCPVRATWKEPDGIVVVDYDWCIGCRYCEAACPYHARRFNWAKPEVPAAEVNPDQAYLSNRIRPAGTMEKCTFCLHRVRMGRLPACLEACPAGARVFGNLLDPGSEVRQVIATKRVYVLKEGLGTVPSFYYFFTV
ncbi:MAG: 4Fe-4S dicluster domain-containing protein [Deltaproteobacteria bacterium]|nr:4Fe-4S dicluster domain-containing protein [Deltaproteobacteria bacterium]